MELLEDYRQKAAGLAWLILRETERVKRTPLENVSLLSMLPILEAAHVAKSGGQPNIETIAPQVHEIILFGSVAIGNPHPGDIDLLVIDNGHFSRVFVTEIRTAEPGTYKLSPTAHNNVDRLFEGFFNYDSKDARLSNALGGARVDLHIFPLDLLTSPAFLDEMANQMADGFFFENVFRLFSRFDGTKFVPATAADLDKKYRGKICDYLCL